MDAEGRQAIDKAAQRISDTLDVAIDVLEDVQRVMSAGRPKKLKIRFGDRVMAELPLALTAAAAIGAGLAAVFLTKLAIEIEHEN